MNENYDPNPLKDLSFEQAAYIHDHSEVGSDLWRNSGYVMSNIQQSIQNRIESEKKKLLK